ncbi:sulfatase-like hydrolase/transferase [Paenibacillus sp. IB182496]|uniref:Sulfatase-like hydrolase/transferase n=1 Tax=Paenibacillus sabuli TaxID=2772509 RepID=A0A927GS14_9BACL|nr:sulfatase-like hydrolase/transferase [Paenibacillus sabuli]MBD2845565.1 sulfatase-like hydrolase/transferase [Paenibacillus sabuli]
MNRPNLVFITTDHQRADSLHMTQCGREVTPHLNRLAAQSAQFERAYCSAPLCVPARTALATGKYPTASGVVCNDWSGETAGDHPPMHQMLAEAGYRLGHFGPQHIRLRPELTARVPFAAYADTDDYRRHAADRGLPAPDPRSRRAVRELQDGNYAATQYSSAHVSAWDGPLADFQDCYFTERAAAFVREQAGTDAPFALFLNIWAPHPPLAVPHPYAGLFDPERIELPANVGLAATGEPAGRRRGVPAQLAEDVTIDAWRRAWAAHLALTHLADACVGRIVEALQQGGVFEDTLLLFMSDHGEHLGQHRMYQKMEMYEQALRVPMLIRLPGTQPVRCEEVVSHLDVLPTMLDALGLDRPAQLDGQSLLPVLRGGAAPADRSVFAQYSGNPRPGDIRRAVVTKRYKYIYDPADAAELYDLLLDPLETVNLAADPAHATVREALHRRMLEWAAAHADTWIGRDNE